MSRAPRVDEPRYPYVHVDVPAAEAERIARELWDLGAEGIEERDATTIDGPRAGTGVTLVAYFPEEPAARSVARALSKRFPARVEFVHGDAWRDAWREHFKPTRIGNRLVVRPSWEPVRTWPGEVVLTLDPGRAFGSGTHETTRLVLREVDRRVHGGERVLDVGCGSGILSVAALLLGADRARAVDVDPDAVAVTCENARDNGVASRLKASTTAVGRLRGQYDLLLANIEARVLVPMAGAVIARLRPGGLAVLSGVLREHWREVAAAYADLHLCNVPAEGEWVALVLRKGGWGPGASP